MQRFRSARKNGFQAGFLLGNIFARSGVWSIDFELKPHGTNCLQKKNKQSLGAKKVAGERPTLCCNALRRAKVGFQTHLEAAFRAKFTLYLQNIARHHTVSKCR